MNLPEIPHLTLLEQLGDVWLARVPAHHWVGEDWICLLVLDDGRMVRGKFGAVDRRTSGATVRPDDPAQLSWLRPGGVCAFFDGYYGERAELVLGAPRRWFKVRYLPAAPEQEGLPCAGTWTAADVATDPARRRVLDLASDHEHCAICWRKIGNCGDVQGFASEQGEWICTVCHSDWITTRSIQFAVDWIGGAKGPGDMTP